MIVYHNGMAEKGCLFTIALIMGVAVMTEASWVLPSRPLAVALGIAVAVGIGWLLTRNDKKPGP